MADETITREAASLLAAQVYALVQACPPGRATTYGWLAAAVGLPRGARVVGWIMNETPDRLHVPAHRVINAKGELTGSWAFGQRGRMRQRLEAEGTPFTADDRVDLKRCGWDPSRDLTDEERARILAAANPADAPASDRLMALLYDDPASPYRIQRADKGSGGE